MRYLASAGSTVQWLPHNWKPSWKTATCDQNIFQRAIQMFLTAWGTCKTFNFLDSFPSVFKSLQSYSMSSLDQVTLMSSTYMFEVHIWSTALNSKSFPWKIKRRGPKPEPCGMPQRSVYGLDLRSFSLRADAQRYYSKRRKGLRNKG